MPFKIQFVEIQCFVFMLFVAHQNQRRIAIINEENPLGGSIAAIFPIPFELP